MAKVQGSLWKKFFEFHQQNPAVYEVVRLARMTRAAGYPQYGIGALWEVARWHINMRTVGDEFKLNNNYRAYYARYIMSREPDLRGFFNLRELRHEKGQASD